MPFQWGLGPSTEHVAEPLAWGLSSPSGGQGWVLTSSSATSVLFSPVPLPPQLSWHEDHEPPAPPWPLPCWSGAP